MMMDLSTLWWLMAGVVLILEMLTGTVYLLLIAAAFVVAALAALGGAPPAPQIVIAAAVGTALVLAWWRIRSKARHADARTAQSDADLNLDIGQPVHVEAWEDDGTASVMHRGARWQAMAAEPASQPLVPGEWRIVALSGSRLVLAPAAA